MWAGCPHPAIGRSLRGEGTSPTVKPHRPFDEKKRLQVCLILFNEMKHAQAKRISFNLSVGRCLDLDCGGLTPLFYYSSRRFAWFGLRVGAGGQCECGGEVGGGPSSRPVQSGVEPPHSKSEAKSEANRARAGSR